MLKSSKIIILSLFLFVISSVKSQDTITVTLGADHLKDAYINIVNSQTNGSSPSLISSVWTYYGEYGIGRSLFGFDFTDLSDGLTVIDARLNLYHDPVSGHLGHSTIGGDNSGMIFRITEFWLEDSVTWANQPSTTNTNAIYVPSPESDTSDFLDIDITPIIKDMIRHPNTSDGFMMKLFSEDTLYRSLVFASSDHPNSDLHPSVVITYVTELPLDSITKIQPDGETGEDATVFSIEPPSFKTNDQSLVSMCWDIDGNWSVGRSYMKFDLSTIDPNHSVTYAELSLFHNPTSIIEGHVCNGESNEIEIGRIIENWSESELSWDNQPEVSDESIVLVSSSNIFDQDYLDIDVTQVVKDMLANNEESFGFFFKLANEDPDLDNRNVVFASSNHPDESLHPKLVIYTQDYSGKDEYPEMSALKVYPNPGAGVFNIQLPDDYYTGELQIFDNYGNLIKVININSNISQVDLSGLTRGVYYLNFLKGEVKIYGKVIIL